MNVVKQGDNMIIRGVPIFDEHVDHGRHANLREVNASKLETILSRSIARLKTEYELPVAFDATNKHTPKPGEEHAPPPVRGGYSNLRIDDFHGRKAIYADLRIPASDYPAVEGFQRRSAEIFPDTLELDTLVLLGSKAPARDLGPLTPRATYSRDGREVVRYEMDAQPVETAEPTQETKNMLSPEDLQQIKAVFVESLNEVINGEQEEQQPEGDLDGDGIPNVEDGDPMGAGEPDGDETGMAVQEPEQYERLRMEDSKRKLEQYERRIKKLEADNAEANRKATSEHYTRRLSELQDKGIELERADELKEIMSMPNDAARDAHLARIEKSYRRDPTFESDAGRQAVKYERTTPSTTDMKGITPEVANRIAAKALELGNWDTARAVVLNGKS